MKGLVRNFVNSKQKRKRLRKVEKYEKNNLAKAIQLSAHSIFWYKLSNPINIKLSNPTNTTK